MPHQRQVQILVQDRAHDLGVVSVDDQANRLFKKVVGDFRFLEREQPARTGRVCELDGLRDELLRPRHFEDERFECDFGGAKKLSQAELHQHHQEGADEDDDDCGGVDECFWGAANDDGGTDGEQDTYEPDQGSEIHK